MFVSKLCTVLFALGVSASPFVLPSYTASPFSVKESHEVPSSWRRIGSADKEEMIHMQIALKQGTQGVVEKHLMEVSDPNHARYGQHLTADEVNDLVRPSEQTMQLVHSWLLSHDIDDISYSPAQDWISIAVSIEQAERLLNTEYSLFRHSDGSTLLRAPEWSLPIDLHDHIDLVQPTSSFFRTRPQVSIAHPLVNAVSAEDVASANAVSEAGNSISQVCNVTFTTPKCLRTLYGTKNYKVQAADKNGVGVNNYLNETSKRTDIYKFLQTFRPKIAEAANKFTIVNIANATDDQGPYTPAELAAGTNIEADLDAETVLAISDPTPFTVFATGGSPPFNPNKYNTANTNEPYLTWLNYALAQQHLPYAISSSYGDVESTVPYSYANRVCSSFAQLGARGISLMVSSGDSGVGGNGTCVLKGKRAFTPAFPTSCPWVTSVGATAYFQPEVAVIRFASGGGFSNYFPTPEYQKSTVDAYIQSLNGLHNGLYNKSGRGYPDVAAQGNHDAIVWNGTVYTVGGTSASSPTFTGVIALVNDALLAKGKRPLGFLNTWLYSGGYEALTDITSGSSYGCNSSGFPAQKGWDAVTGFGTPNFSKLVAAALAKS